MSDINRLAEAHRRVSRAVSQRAAGRESPAPGAGAGRSGALADYFYFRYFNRNVNRLKTSRRARLLP